MPILTDHRFPSGAAFALLYGGGRHDARRHRGAGADTLDRVTETGGATRNDEAVNAA